MGSRGRTALVLEDKGKSLLACVRRAYRRFHEGDTPDIGSTGLHECLVKVVRSRKGVIKVQEGENVPRKKKQPRHWTAVELKQHKEHLLDVQKVVNQVRVWEVEAKRRVGNNYSAVWAFMSESATALYGSWHVNAP